MISNQNYFEQRARSDHFAALDHDITVDTLIIGTGITGLAAAHCLLKSGRRVALLEAEEVGSRTLSRSGGLVTREVEFDYSAFAPRERAAFHHLSTSGVDQLVTLVKQEGLTCDLEEGNDSLYLVYRPWQRRHLLGEKAGLESVGESAIELLGTHELRSLFAGENFAAALRTRGHYAVNPAALAHEMARLVTQLRGSIYTRTAVQGFDPAAHRAFAVNGSSVHYGSLLLCTGTATVTFPPLQSLRTMLLPVVSEVGVTRPLSAAELARVFPGGTNLHLSDLKFSFNYARVTPDGAILFGGGGRFLRLAEALRGEAPRRRSRFSVLKHEFDTYFPSLCALGFVNEWDGIIAISSDMQPVLGEFERDAWVATFAPGINMGFATGELAARMMNGSPCPEELWPYCRWDRRPSLREAVMQAVLTSPLCNNVGNAAMNLIDSFIARGF